MTLSEIFKSVWANDKSDHKQVAFELLQHVTLSHRITGSGLLLSFNDGSNGKLDAFNNTCEILP